MFKATYTSHPAPEKAAKEIAAAVAEALDAPPALVLYFASTAYPPEKLAQAMQSAFGDVPVMGCTTAGECHNGRFLHNGIEAMAFSQETLHSQAASLVTDIYDPSSLEAAFLDLENMLHQDLLELSPEQYVGLTLINGMTKGEETVMDAIADKSNIPFIGGSAGDDFRLQETNIFYKGKAYSGGALLLLLEPTLPFTCIKTQSFSELDKKLLATSVNESERVVFEFNNTPALAAYCDSLGISREVARESFLTNPLGLMIGGEPYVRSPRNPGDNGSLEFHSMVRQGMEFSLLKAGNVIADTRKALDAARDELGNITALLQFECCLRFQDIEERGLADQYESLFTGIEAAGFSTYGEQFIGHNNQTAVMLAFFEPSSDA